MFIVIGSYGGRVLQNLRWKHGDFKNDLFSVWVEWGNWSRIGNR